MAHGQNANPLESTDGSTVDVEDCEPKRHAHGIVVRPVNTTTDELLWLILEQLTELNAKM